MFKSILNFFKEPDPKPQIQDKQKISKTYNRFQWQILGSCYIGYVISYIGRQNLAASYAELEKQFGFKNIELGHLGTAFFATYAIGKFVNGILADKANVRTFYSFALIFAAICLLGFSTVLSFGWMSNSVLLMCLCCLWGANGWFQSMMFPPISKSLSFWFTRKERGSRWSVISTSHQVGAICGTVLAAFAIQNISLKSAFYLPGIISLIGGVLLLILLRDKPVTIGLPDVETYKESISENLSNDSNINDENIDGSGKKAKTKESYFQILIKHILCNPTVWLVVIAYLFIYIVRTASEQWLMKFFISQRGNDTLTASGKTSINLLIGAFGTILSGLVSDKFFKGRRTPVNILFLGGLLISLICFANNPMEFKHLDIIYISLIGLFTSGLQNLVGLQVVEMCAKDVASAANGFAGTMSYIGAILASSGTGYMLDHHGWSGAFNYWIFSTIAAIVIFILLIPVERAWKTKVNKMEEAA